MSLAVWFAFAAREPAADPRLKRAARQPENNGWIAVRLEGTPSEIGYQHGYLLAPEIQDAFQVISLELTGRQQERLAILP